MENDVTRNYNFVTSFLILKSFVSINFRDKQYDNSRLKHEDENYKYRIVHHFVFTFDTQSNLSTTAILGTGKNAVAERWPLWGVRGEI